jgi:perosamine synthetase
VYVPVWQGLAPRVLRAPNRPSELPYPLDRPQTRYFYLARAGIYHAARLLLGSSPGTVLVPSYHNGLEVLALRAAGATPRFFRIGSDLAPDLDDIRSGLREGARLVLVIHYNGWPQPIEEIRGLCREHGASMIEDCALALLSSTRGVPLGSFGDAAVFCLYKTLPVPHGATLSGDGLDATDLNRIRLRTPSTLSTAARTADLSIAWIRSRASRTGAVLACTKSWIGTALNTAHVKRETVGGMRFDPSVFDLGVSPWMRGLLPRFDYEEIVQARRRNFLHLLEALRERSTPLLRSLPDGVCPLFFPLIVEDKSAAVRILASRGIEAVEFWNHGDPEAESDHFADSVALRRHVIELPIHQNLTPDHVDHIARAVLELDLGMAA